MVHINAVSPYRQHVERWKGCTRCELCHGRARVVFARGQVPCDVLFVGEAPGDSENVLGSPFKGQAGRLLDQIVERAWLDLTAAQVPGPTVGFYNLVGCFPRDAKATDNHEPPSEAIEACAPRLQEFVAIANPKLIVCVGRLAKDWLEVGYRHTIQLPEGIAQAFIIHPSAILQAPTASRGLIVQRCVADVTDAVESIFQGAST